MGRALMRQLAEAGHEAVEHTGRINNPFTLREQLREVQVVYHLASSEARGRNRLLNHVDLEGTERLLEECQRANVQQIIFVSRIGADPQALHPLLRTKGQIERMIERSGVPYTILRSASVFGWGDRYSELLVGLAIWSWPFVWLPSGGKTAVQPWWVEDLARCLCLSLNNPALINKTVRVAGEEPISYRRFVLEMLETAGLRRIPLRVPLPLIRPLSLLLFQWWYWPPITRYLLDRFFVPEVIPTDSVRRVFGFRPTPIQEALAHLNRAGLRWRLFRK